jgi:hypothetical protein
MKYIVTQTHETEFTNPIIVKQGEKIIIEKETDEDYENWFLCKKLDESNSGWIPVEIIKKENNYGIITEDYSAKELNVKNGYIVKGIKELNGWLFCECENTNEIGWVPIANIKKME